jgi:signal transduction histidine kinase
MIVIRNISVIIEFEKVKNENKYQELLTATMSHEMLTPLNSIINLAIYIEQKLFQRFIKEKDIPGMEGSRGGSSSDKVDVK